MKLSTKDITKMLSSLTPAQIKELDKELGIKKPRAKKGAERHKVNFYTYTKEVNYSCSLCGAKWTESTTFTAGTSKPITAVIDVEVDTCKHCHEALLPMPKEALVELLIKVARGTKPFPVTTRNLLYKKAPPIKLLCSHNPSDVNNTMRDGRCYFCGLIVGSKIEEVEE